MSRSLMKLIAILFFLSLPQLKLNAQNISNYSFVTGTNGNLEDLSTGSSNYLTGNNDNVSGTVTALPFPFNFMGVTYNYFSSNSNGQMSFHTTAGATPINSTAAAGLNTNEAILAPFAGDNEGNNGIRYKTIGSAPCQLSNY